MSVVVAEATAAAAAAAEPEPEPEPELELEPELEPEPEPEPELLRTYMAGSFFSSLCRRRAPSFEHPLAGPATAHKGLALQLSRATSNGLATLFCSAVYSLCCLQLVLFISCAVYNLCCR